MVLIDAVSPFSKNRRFPLSSTTQMVTETFNSLAFASDAATIVLMAARSIYFFVGRSSAFVTTAERSMTTNSLIKKSLLQVLGEKRGHLSSVAGLLLHPCPRQCAGGEAGWPCNTTRNCFT